MQAGKRRLLLTGDGSHTIASEGGALSYHSVHGAIQESKHVFIEAGLHKASIRFPEGTLRILEMGFGTGLNALLSAIEAESLHRRLHYVSLEKYPLERQMIEGLNYPDRLGQARLFQAMHDAPWNEAAQLTPCFILEKQQSDMLEFSARELFQLIYFDAFAPDVQPELWSESAFEKLALLTVSGGILTTYCSKGSVRRAMQAAGWMVEKLPGPPGKREMVRAIRL